MSEQWSKPWFIFLISSLIIFGPSLYFSPFIFDDYAYVFENTKVLRPTLDNFLYYLTKSLTPLPFLLWKFIAVISKESPFFYRLMNILIHALNSYLVFLLACKLFGKGKDQDQGNDNPNKERTSWPVWFCAFVYLSHPVQVESVVWISSLKTLMASSFAMVFILFSLPNPKTNQTDSYHLLLAVISYLFGLLCNPTMASVIFVPFIFAKVLELRISKNQIIGIILGTIVAMAIVFSHKSDVLSSYFDQLSPLLRAKVIFTSLSTYLLNALFPFSLTFDYQINALSVSYLDEIGQASSLIIMGPLAFFTGLAFLLRERTRALGLFILSFFVLLTPHIGLVLHDFNNISVVSDRYLNLAMLAFSLSVSWTLHHLVKWAAKKFEKIPPMILPCFIGCILVGTTFYQISRWQEPKGLMKSSQNLLELRAPVLVALGNQFLGEENFKQARLSFKQALAANPESPAAFLSLLILNEKSPLKGEDEFIDNFLKSHYLTFDIETSLYLARLYVRLKKYQAASNIVEGLKLKRLTKDDWKEVSALEIAIERRKKDFALDAHLVLEAYYASELKFEEALYHVNEILKLEPGVEEYQFKKDDYEEELKVRK